MYIGQIERILDKNVFFLMIFGSTEGWGGGSLKSDVWVPIFSITELAKNLRANFNRRVNF